MHALHLCCLLSLVVSLQYLSRIFVQPVNGSFQGGCGVRPNPSLTTPCIWRVSSQAFRRVAPGRGKRSHITLTGWFGGAATEVFCGEEVRAAAPAGRVHAVDAQA